MIRSLAGRLSGRRRFPYLGVCKTHALLLTALALSFVVPAHAHDPQESWTNATLFPDSLKVEITMAQYCAMILLDPKGKAVGLDENNFPQFRERMKALAKDLYVITSVRTPLKPTEVDAKLSEENDLIFTLVYPRPALGRLYFHATFLTKLGDGFGGTIYLSDPKGKDLGWDQISAEAPNFEVTIAPPAPAPKKTP